MLLYNERPYANERLADTIVRARINDRLKAVMVMAIRYDDGLTTVRVLSTRNVEDIQYEQLDITPVPLGYVNHPKVGCGYVCRRPMRQDWRQGLRAKSFICIDGFWGPMTDVPLKQLADCIENEYPSLDKVIGKTINNPNLEPDLGMAFHRDFAINQRGDLLWKSLPVAKIDRNRNVEWSPQFEFVVESYQEAIGA